MFGPVVWWYDGCCLEVALWDRFSTTPPRRLRRSVVQSKLVKSANASFLVRLDLADATHAATVRANWTLRPQRLLKLIERGFFAVKLRMAENGHSSGFDDQAVPRERRVCSYIIAVPKAGLRPSERCSSSHLGG